MIRNTWRSGDSLAIDDESGLCHYASDMVRDWDGQMRHKDNLDGRHPQLDVRAKRDPVALRNVRDRAATGAGGDYLVQEDGVLRIGLEEDASFCLLAETVTVR
jgi:hypothetical protein